MQRRTDSIQWFNQRTNHGAALKLAAERVFNKAGGDRSYADNVMVLVTDSASNTENLKREDIKALKDAGVRIFVIAVATKDASEARSIASEPTFYYLTQVLSYMEMWQVFRHLERIVCKKDFPKPVFSLSSAGMLKKAQLETRVS